MLNRGLLWGLAAYLAVVWDTTTPSPWAPCAAVIWVLQFSLYYPQYAVWGGALIGLLSDAGQHAWIGPGVVAGGLVGWGVRTWTLKWPAWRAPAYGCIALAGAAIWLILPALGHWVSSGAVAGQWSSILIREGNCLLTTVPIAWALARQAPEADGS